MNDTTLTLVGRIVDVPKRRLTESGVSVLNMRVGSTARRFDRENQKWVDGDSTFVNVTCWRSLADNVSRSLVQGDAVVVHGRFFTREYEHNGQRRSSYDMEAYAVGPDLTWARVEYVRTKRDPITHEIVDAVSTPVDCGLAGSGPATGAAGGPGQAAGPAGDDLAETAADLDDSELEAERELAEAIR